MDYLVIALIVLTDEGTVTSTTTESRVALIVAGGLVTILEDAVWRVTSIMSTVPWISTTNLGVCACEGRTRSHNQQHGSSIFHDANPTGDCFAV